MNVWDVNTEVLLLQHTQSPLGTAVVPSADKPNWPQLLGDEALFEELKDYFCYAQLTTRPLDTTEGFDLDGKFTVGKPRYGWGTAGGQISGMS